MRALLISLALAAAPALAADRPAQAPLDLADPVADKNFYLFRLIERSRDARAAVAADPELAAIHTAYVAGLGGADRTCAAEPACYAAAARLTPAQTAAAEQALRRLYAVSPALRRVVDIDLRASGAFPPAADGADLLAGAWREQAAALKRIIDTYGEGLPPPYPDIDSPANDPKTPAWSRRLRLANAVVMERDAADQPFFAAPAAYAVLLLRAEERDEAGRLEPMAAGENAAALKRMGRTRWSRYPYSAILAPGSGGARPDERLSATGALRAELAYTRWKAGKAPFIVVSGGYVHPARTPFAEAIEMKRYLMAALHVPEDAILVDPHARHTTTNVRNTVRLLWRGGAPMDRKVLVVTDESQTRYIAAPVFDERNRVETGALPYRAKAQLGRFEVEITPSPDALWLSPTDPLDP